MTIRASHAPTEGMISNPAPEHSPPARCHRERLGLRDIADSRGSLINIPNAGPVNPVDTVDLYVLRDKPHGIALSDCGLRYGPLTDVAPDDYVFCDFVASS